MEFSKGKTRISVEIRIEIVNGETKKEMELGETLIKKGVIATMVRSIERIS